MPRISYVFMVLLLGWLLAGTAGAAVSAAGGAASGSSGQPASPGNAEAPDQGAVVLGGKSGAQQLEQSAEDLYGYVLEGNVAKVRQATDEVSRIFVSSSFEGLTSVEGINALSSVIMDVKTAVSAVQSSPERWEAAAAKLRLAANSLNHPRQPMWLQYYKLIREDLNAMAQSASANDLKGWQTALSRLDSRYNTIRPAVIISRQPDVVNVFDSWLSHAAGIPKSSQPSERAKLLEMVSYGQEAARVMFGKEKDEPALTTPLAPEGYSGWGMLAAAFILVALGYAGYRKYRGDSKEWKAV
ncbi:sporulation protein [Paenibacillus albidus]|uniref:sporulation protein YpjB n=1 Tax=Paenibacillus albidus TaxID=2041023 RepID=UPI001BE98DE0|nr:sporulation protein YpjB [Paenibacillus albidus]MBT2288563.1 sporulation protein [Paenibacillus albidus]